MDNATTGPAAILQASLPLASLRDVSGSLSLDERRVIAEQVQKLIQSYYVHLPLKTSSLAIDPVQETNLLIDDIRFIPEGNDQEFYRRLLLIIKRLRDRHTTFKLPEPFSSMVAYLPFTAEAYWEANHRDRRMIVTKLMVPLDDPAFVPGVTLTHWNGVSIGRYVETFSWENEGSNPYARIAIALRSLTTRPMAYSLPPIEDWASLTYIDLQGRVRNVVIPWRVYIPPSTSNTAHAGVEPKGTAPAIVQGIDRNAAIVNETWHDLFSARADVSRPNAVLQCVNRLSGPLSSNLYFGSVRTVFGEFGYIRLFSFEAEDSVQFVHQFIEILRSLPQAGLILDVRDNPGGTIPSGEALMQLFSDGPILTAPTNFRTTPAIQRICNGIGFFDLWKRSLNLRFETGDQFSQAFSLTSSDLSREFQRVYHGAVVLIINSLCYSTTDFISAGFQDNGIAWIIGMDPTTGGGGANVWTHRLLAQFDASLGGSSLVPLPREADMNIAMRRSLRVGKNAGLPVEGLGVSADELYYITRRDVLESNADLMSYAAFRLSLLQ